MKKKSIALLFALIAYSYLFYQQSEGINFIIFNALLVSLLLIIDKTLIQSRIWISIACCALISAVSVLLYGNFLSSFGNVLSLILLAHLSIDRNSSLVFSLLQSLWSYLNLPVLAVEKMIATTEIPQNTEKENVKESAFTFANLLKFIIPLLILLTFFIIYKSSNPIFSKFIDGLNISISWNFIGFFILGSLLIYGFFNQKKSPTLSEIDQNASNMLTGGIKEKEKSFFSSIDKEFSAAIMTFALLNILLLLVNILDVNFIFSGQQATVSDYSQYVHQGINSSIFSVIIAIFVTLYFFRGNLNFIAKNKSVKILALIWILLNVVLLITCLHKNASYIADSGLTHKRIGVYFYLFLTFVGLVTTWIKITQLKSNWFLVRMNLWPVYLTLIFASLYNWNKLILNHNSHNTASIEREYYFQNLGETSLPYLLQNWQKLPSDSYRGQSDESFRKLLKYKTLHFIHKYEKADWQSWNMEDERIYKLIKKSVRKK